MKMEISEENLSKRLPAEFSSHMKYVKHSEFEEDPLYKYLKGLFLYILSKNGYGNNLNFFWMTKPNYPMLFPKKNISLEKRKIDKDELYALKKLNSSSRDSSFSRNRLYNSIKNSLNKNRKIMNLNQEKIQNETFEKKPIC